MLGQGGLPLETLGVSFISFNGDPGIPLVKREVSLGASNSANNDLQQYPTVELEAGKEREELAGTIKAAAEFRHMSRFGRCHSVGGDPGIPLVK